MTDPDTRVFPELLASLAFWHPPPIILLLISWVLTTIFFFFVGQWEKETDIFLLGTVRETNKKKAERPLWRENSISLAIYPDIKSHYSPVPTRVVVMFWMACLILL